MLKETITGIAQKLSQVFGEGYGVYADNVAQGVNGPYFVIVCLPGTQDQKIGNLYDRKQPFNIQYVPQTQSSGTEITEVLDALMLAMEYIEIAGNVVRGTRVRYDIQVGVLHFFINYDVHVRKISEPDDYMEHLGINERVKADGYKREG